MGRLDLKAAMFYGVVTTIAASLTALWTVFVFLEVMSALSDFVGYPVELPIQGHGEKDLGAMFRLNIPLLLAIVGIGFAIFFPIFFVLTKKFLGFVFSRLFPHSKE